MGIIKKTVLNSIIYKNNKIYQFDHPIKLHGNNHRVINICNHFIENKKLKFYITDYYPHVIFLSSSESLGVFFLNYDIPIYTTKTISKQLVFKIKMYQKLNLYYDDNEGNIDDNLYMDNKEHINNKDNKQYINDDINNKNDHLKLVSIDDINLERFYKNLNFINTGESVDDIKILSSQKVLGWVYFLFNNNYLYCGSFGMSKLINNIDLSDYTMIRLDNTKNCFYNKYIRYENNENNELKRINIKEFNEILKLDARKIIIIDPTINIVEFLIHLYTLINNKNNKLNKYDMISYNGTKSELMEIINVEELKNEYKKIIYFILDKIKYGFNLECDVCFVNNLELVFYTGIYVFIGYKPIYYNIGGYLICMDENEMTELVDNKIYVCLNDNNKNINDYHVTKNSNRGNNDCKSVKMSIDDYIQIVNKYNENKVDNNFIKNTYKLSDIKIKYIKKLFKEKYFYYDDWFYFYDKKIKIKLGNEIIIKKY